MTAHLRIALLALAGVMLFTVGTTYAQPSVSDCVNPTSELVVVQPLNTQFVRTTTPPTGAQLTMVVSPVECTLSPDGCYEFGVLPVAYPGPSSPSVVDASILTMGHDVSIEITPLAGVDVEDTLPLLLTQPTGTWDGVSTAGVVVDTTFDPTFATNRPLGAKIQVPAGFIQDNPLLTDLGIGSSSAVVGLVRAIHTPPSPDPEACGYYQVVKRNFVGNQLVAKSFESQPTPVVFLRQAGEVDSEVLVVEPLNVQFAGTQTPVVVGAKNVLAVSPVLRPEGLCDDNPTTNELTHPDPMSCFEFAIVYVSYDEISGEQILHLPNPDPSDPIQAPIPVGDELRVEIVPFSGQLSDPIQVPAGKWENTDPTATNRAVHLYTTRSGGFIQMNRKYETATVRIAAGRVRDLLPSLAGFPGITPGLIMATHDPLGTGRNETGFFYPTKRNYVFNRDLANAHDAAAVPVFFLLDPENANDREVILVEPLNMTLLSLGPIGAKVPVIRCVNNGTDEVFQFTTTYVTYPSGLPRVHEVGSGTAPIVGAFDITVSADDALTSATGSWDGSTSVPTYADIVPDDQFATFAFDAALVEVLASEVMNVSALGAGPMVWGTILSTHTNGTDVSEGFFNAVKRNVAHTQALGNTLDEAPTPVLFQGPPCIATSP